MRKLRIATAVAIVSATLVALTAGPAAAKGPRSATIEGPGLDAPIEETGAGVSKLPALTGLFGALWSDPTITLVDEAPTAELGPAWVITWDMGEDAGPTGRQSAGPDLVRQTVYPDAAGGPLVHTEAGQPFSSEATSGGWYEAPSALTGMLRMLGVPAGEELAGSSGPSGEDSDRAELAAAPSRATTATPTSDGSSSGRLAGAGAGAGAVAVVAAAAAGVLIRRRRTSA